MLATQVSFGLCCSAIAFTVVGSTALRQVWGGLFRDGRFWFAHLLEHFLLARLFRAGIFCVECFWGRFFWARLRWIIMGCTILAFAYRS
jgi:hypothetical protein